jgi:hypothetical protein
MEVDMNLLPRVAEKLMKRPRSSGKYFLLGTAIVLFVVVGPGVGSSISKQQDRGFWQTTSSVKATKVPTNRNDQVDIRFRQMKERAERRRVATQLQDVKIKIDPEKRKKIALLLLLATGQAYNSNRL